MSGDYFLSATRVLVLLAPLPFGCVGRPWSSLFYLLLLGISLPLYLQRFPRRGRDGKPAPQEIYPYEKKIRLCFYCLLGVIFFQAVPLPRVVPGLFSPATLAAADAVKSVPPDFQSISVRPAETLAFGLRFLALAIFFQVLVNIPLTRYRMFSLIHTLILSSVIQVVVGIAKWLGGNRLFFVFFYEDPEPLGRLTGTIAHPDHFAAYLAMIVPLALGMLAARVLFPAPHLPLPTLREKLAALFLDRGNLFYYVLPVLASVAGIAATGSVTGLIVLLLTLFMMVSVLFYFSEGATGRRRLGAALVVILVAAGLGAMQKNLGHLAQNPNTDLDYFTCWTSTAQILSNFPVFGSGFGSFPSIYLLYGPQEPRRVTHAHNDYLETLSDGGLIGGLLLFMLVGGLLVSLYRLWMSRENLRIKAVVLGPVAACVGMLFQAFTGFALRIPAISLTFVVILALGIKVSLHRTEHRHGG